MKVVKKFFHSISGFLILGAKVIALFFVFSALDMNRFFISDADKWVMKDVDNQIREIEEKQRIKAEQEKIALLKKERERIEAEANAKMKERFDGVADVNLRAQYEALNTGESVVSYDSMQMNNSNGYVHDANVSNVQETNRIDVSITVSDTGASVNVDDGESSSDVIVSNTTPEQDKINARRKAIFGGQ